MPQDKAQALCEATREFLNTHKSGLLNSYRGNATLAEDLHQLTALLGAWEREQARKTEHTQPNDTTCETCGKTIHLRDKKLSIYVGDNRSTLGHNPYTHMHRPASVEPKPPATQPHPVDCETNPHNL